MNSRFVREIAKPSQMTVLHASCGLQTEVPWGCHVELRHFGEDGMQPTLVTDREFSLRGQELDLLALRPEFYGDPAIDLYGEH